jgi:hypothetical protein
MKTILLLSTSLIALSAAARLLESPELLPKAVLDTIPVLSGTELSADDESDLNRKYGSSTFKERKAERSWAQLSSLRATSRNSGSASGAVKPILLAQAGEPPVPPTPPSPPPPPSADADPAEEDQHITKELERAKREVDRARQTIDREVQRGMGAQDFSNFHLKFTGPAQEQRSLVIRSSETDPKSLAMAEEDLNVMARILDRAVAKTGGREDKKAMGISLISFGNGAKNFQIEGFGAVFLLKVNFPLSGPPAKMAEEKPREPSNSAWDEAKRELYGAREGASGGKLSGARSVAPRMEYDPNRVEELKGAILEASKNASNMRALKEGESVTVVVTSGEAPTGTFQRMTAQAFAVGGAEGGATGWAEAVPPGESGSGKPAVRTGSTLTIRAKKSDIDAFSQGKMNLDEFRRKAMVSLY